MIKIGELSSISGVTPQTIRFYEDKGLICPIEVDRWTDIMCLKRREFFGHIKSPIEK